MCPLCLADFTSIMSSRFIHVRTWRQIRKSSANDLKVQNGNKSSLMSWCVSEFPSFWGWILCVCFLFEIRYTANGAWLETKRVVRRTRRGDCQEPGPRQRREGRGTAGRGDGGAGSSPQVGVSLWVDTWAVKSFSGPWRNRAVLLFLCVRWSEPCFVLWWVQATPGCEVPMYYSMSLWVGASQSYGCVTHTHTFYFWLWPYT